MPRITPLTTDHQSILECLAVLRLLVGRMETDDDVDPADVRTVMDFMRDIGCECLEHTEQLLLRPALSRATQQELSRRLRTALARHHTVRPLVDDATAVLTSCKRFVMRVHLVNQVDSDPKQDDVVPLLEDSDGVLNDADGQRNVEISDQRGREK